MDWKCIIYRTGGTENFIWKRTSAMDTNEAESTLKAMRNMGYECFMEDYHSSVAIGLPETYIATEDGSQRKTP